ncbi:MAG: citrate lyase holo-[Anaerolineaceae bacterium]|jgi:holo-ACP synthase|nr:citrate lyase holo-[acyl-carrier protein] synthase [Oscillospiraceae bacterium]MBQ6481537.1 citrate lyase holo-[acyl-carrier protein] synthase [Anaerolineaceae bacterium]
MANEVTIQDMMACRDRRVELQNDLLKRFKGNPILSFCLNIPGPIKTDPEIRAAFLSGKDEILSVLSGNNLEIAGEYEIHEKTGDEWIASIYADPDSLKKQMCEIEDGSSLGRIFDIDVLTPDGRKLSRKRYRTCLICSRQAQECARSRRHSAAELFRKVKELIREDQNIKN